MNRIATKAGPASTAARIGRFAENNLSSLATAALAELARADGAGGDTGELLAVGLAILRARQVMRDGIREVERQGKMTARKLHGGRQR